MDGPAPACLGALENLPAITQWRDGLGEKERIASASIKLIVAVGFAMDLHDVAQAIVTVLAVINPLVCGSIFLTLTQGLPPVQRRRAARKAALAILFILVGSALIGVKVLIVFGISLDVFRIVGGLIIAYIGFDMLRGHQNVAQAPPMDDDIAAPSSLGPLVMFAAGPGTITVVVTLAAVHSRGGLPLTAIVAAAIGTGVTFAVSLLSVGAGAISRAARKATSPVSWDSLWPRWGCSSC